LARVSASTSLRFFSPALRMFLSILVRVLSAALSRLSSASYSWGLTARAEGMGPGAAPGV
jgi:hypothetical protein